MAKYLTQEGVELLVQTFDNKINLKVDKSELDDYATKADLAEVDIDIDLDDYAKTTDLAGLASESYVNSAVADKTTKSYVDGLFANVPAQYDDTALKGRVTALEGKATGLYHFKGSVENLAALGNIQNPEVGDTYNLQDTGMNAAWTGTEWDEFGSVQDLTAYAKKEDVVELTRTELNTILFSGKTAVVTNQESFEAVLANNQPEVEITVNNDLNLDSPLIVPAGKEVTIKLGDNDITSGNKVAVAAVGAGSKLIIEGTGRIESSANGTVVAQQGGEVVLNGVEVVSTTDNCVSATGAGSKVTINSGSVTAQEYGVIVTTGAEAEINGGTIKGLDNFALGGNGSAGKAPGTVTINGGRLEGHIQSNGYIATAIYWPNEGTLNINGGEIVSDGAGIVQRGGTINIGANANIVANGASRVMGKAGDSRVVVGPYAIVFDTESNYPARNTMQLNIADGAILMGTDGDIQRIPSDVAGITDNRQIIGD